MTRKADSDCQRTRGVLPACECNPGAHFLAHVASKKLVDVLQSAMTEKQEC